MVQSIRPGIAVTALLCAAALDGLAEQPAAILLPLGEQAGWQVLRYRNLPSHRIRFSEAGLEMGVDASAMPLVFPLPKAMQAAYVRVKGRVEGTLRVPPQRQGERGFDDYVFRLGLVESGSRTLNAVERRTAPLWVRRLFELAPKGGGISRIHFLNVGADRSQIGRRRQHPLSELISEQVVAAPGPDGGFDFVHSLEQPLQTLAVWLSSDGDDTASKFTVFVEEIELRSAPP